MRPHEIVESALAQCTVDAMTVICQEHSQTNLRWAANTLTTNGVMRSVDITVVAVAGSGTGRAAGVASASVADASDVAAIVARAEAAARASDPSPDAGDLIAGATSDTFDTAPEETSPDVFSRVCTGARRLVRARQRRGVRALRLCRARGDHRLPWQHRRTSPAPCAADRAPGDHRKVRWT